MPSIYSDNDSFDNQQEKYYTDPVVPCNSQLFCPDSAGNGS